MSQIIPAATMDRIKRNGTMARLAYLPGRGHRILFKDPNHPAAAEWFPTSADALTRAEAIGIEQCELSAALSVRRV